MEEKIESSSSDVPVLDVIDYFDWRSKMKAYLKKFGVWEIVINPPAPSNKKGKSAAKKEAKKDNTTTLKFLMDGLPSRSEGKCRGVHFSQRPMVQVGKQVSKGKTRT